MTEFAHDRTGPGRQIVLPLSKAVEIAYKSIRLRLARSLLVTSGIVLAIAFLMSILTGDALLVSMRNWTEHASGGDRATVQRLMSAMKQHGVPTTPQEMHDNRIQTRWILSLALLVAFAGI